MVKVPFVTSDWRRTVAGKPNLPLVNRYFEQTPTSESGALLSRPALKRWLTIGTGPIKGVYSQPGSFGDDLFAVSGEDLYQVGTDNTTTLRGTGILNANPQGFVSMAATSAIGSTPEFLYIADGVVLWLYMENGYAIGTLTASGNIVDTDVVRIGDIYYQWTAGSVNAGTPAGTAGNPWLVDLGADSTESLDSLRLAINNEGTPGVTYSTALDAHPTVLARSSTTNTLRVQARDAGAAGNSIVTTETGANIAWSAGTLTGGGAPLLTTVDVPDDLGALAVAFIAGYIIVVPSSVTPGFKGRFFWIEPGETFIRPLNFATAERAPDPLRGVRVVGDQIWLLGANTTEVWYATGDFETPFIRTQGSVFDRGIVEGTDVQIKDSVVVTDTDGAVYVITGGGPQRVSNPSIEERIRLALRLSEII
jgi:hypothetical protein